MQGFRLDIFSDGISDTGASVAFGGEAGQAGSDADVKLDVRGLGGPRAAWNSVEVLTLMATALLLSGSAANGGTRPWGDIPGVVLVGILMGLGFVIVAIRTMFKKK